MLWLVLAASATRLKVCRAPEPTGPIRRFRLHRAHSLPSAVAVAAVKMVAVHVPPTVSPEHQAVEVALACRGHASVDPVRMQVMVTPPHSATTAATRRRPVVTTPVVVAEAPERQAQMVRVTETGLLAARAVQAKHQRLRAQPSHMQAVGQADSSRTAHEELAARAAVEMAAPTVLRPQPEPMDSVAAAVAAAFNPAHWVKAEEVATESSSFDTQQSSPRPPRPRQQPPLQPRRQPRVLPPLPPRPHPCCRSS